MMTMPQVDTQWLDYYALLEVPVGADEDTIRKRIGKVYADAAANSNHRNTAQRHYFQSLVESVLPQCRHVLLDAEWRARYDRQHTLHQIGDGAAQDYVSFIASMRGGAPAKGAALLQRAQDEIQAARLAVETAMSGAELELLPSQTVSACAPNPAPAFSQDAMPSVGIPAVASAIAQSDADFKAARAAQLAAKRAAARRYADTAESQPYLGIGDAPTPIAAPKVAPATTHANAPAIVAKVEPTPVAPPQTAQGAPATNAPSTTAQLPSQAQLPAQTVAEPRIETRQQPGEPARATVITAQEAADIRRRRASNPDAEFFVGPGSLDTKNRRSSRVAVEVEDPALRRKLSPTSLNLMVAITGVLLTITIQRFASTPAVATSAGRTPIFVAVAPELEGALESASQAWEKTPGGATYDVIVQPLDSGAGVRRALGKSGDLPDVWIPANEFYAQCYNQLAPAAKRPLIEAGASIAQTPMVLVARSDRAAGLRARFANHQIPNWSALRDAVMADGAGHFGLSDPRQAAPGAIARLSMAREWGQSHGQSAQVAAKNAAFWKWMAGFEENVPSFSPAPDAMVKDLVLGTTGRYWWAVSYESDALSWMAQGKPIELFYLPSTGLADHPFCAVERVGAPLEVAAGRTNFARFLQSSGVQKSLLQSGLRPTEISPSSRVENNPFTQTGTRAGGVKLDGLPRDERVNFDALNAVQSKWADFYG